MDHQNETPYTYGSGSHHQKASAARAGAMRVRNAADAVHAKYASKIMEELKELDDDGLPPQSQRQVPGSGEHDSHAFSAAGSAQYAAGAFVGQSILEQVKQSARDMKPAAIAQAQAQRQQEANMLKNMFQAVWPDLGSFRTWGSATKVASMSGSLSLSVAFFGMVYYLNSQYDKAAGMTATAAHMHQDNTQAERASQH